jgi:nicotinate phosphoribosyltransferase
MKLSRGKTTYPGRKQVFRMRGAGGLCVKDVVALEEERLDGKPLLGMVMEKGKRIVPSQSLERIRSRVQEELALFPAPLREITDRYQYPVEVSPRLRGLTKRVTRRLERGQG